MTMSSPQSKSRFSADVPDAKFPPECRGREPACTSWVAANRPSPELPALVKRISNPDVGIADKALDELIELTMWQEENQREVAELGANSLLFGLIRSRIKYSAAPAGAAQASPSDNGHDAAAVTKALNVLLNVSANDDLASRVASVPGGVALLTELLSHPNRDLVVFSARCLINLTQSSSESQAAALQVSMQANAKDASRALCLMSTIHPACHGMHMHLE